MTTSNLAKLYNDQRSGLIAGVLRGSVCRDRARGRSGAAASTRRRDPHELCPAEPVTRGRDRLKPFLIYPVLRSVNEADRAFTTRESEEGLFVAEHVSFSHALRNAPRGSSRSTRRTKSAWRL